MPTARRRQPGEGSVRYCDKRNRWVAEIDLGVVQGKRKRARKYFATQREAVAYARRAIRAKEDGLPQSDARTTLAAHLDHWMSDVVEPSDRSDSTKAGYENAVRNHLKPALGDHRLIDLRHEHVLTFMRSMRDKGASKSTMHTALVVLRMALKQAVIEERLTRNVARDVDVPAPKSPTPPTRRLTVEERDAFLSVLLGDRLGALFFLMYVLGLRRGEAIGLRLIDVDFDKKIVRICQQITRVTGKGLVTTQPKRQKERTLSFGATTETVLRRHLGRRTAEAEALGDAWKESGLVFVSPEGTALDPSNVTHLMGRLALKAKIKHATPHSLRRTFADHAHAQGVGDKQLQQAMGHSDIGMTLDTYVGTSTHTDAAFAELVEQGLGDLLADSLADTEPMNEEALAAETGNKSP